MNKLIKTSFLGLMLVLGNYAFGQNTQAKFVSSGSAAVSVGEAGGLKATYITGTINSTPAVSFSFQNTSNVNVVFTWTLKDKNNITLFTSRMYKMMPATTIDESNNPVLGNPLSFVIKAGTSPSDCRVEIKMISPAQK